MARSRRLPSVITGAAGGTFSGLTGVGGGALMVPLLTGWLKLGQHRAHAAGVLPYAAAGANRLDGDVLKRIYGLTALTLGLQTVYSSAGGIRAGRHVAPVEIEAV